MTAGIHTQYQITLSLLRKNRSPAGGGTREPRPTLSPTITGTDWVGAAKANRDMHLFGSLTCTVRCQNWAGIVDLLQNASRQLSGEGFLPLCYAHCKTGGLFSCGRSLATIEWPVGRSTDGEVDLHRMDQSRARRRERLTWDGS